MQVVRIYYNMKGEGMRCAWFKIVFSFKYIIQAFNIPNYKNIKTKAEILSCIIYHILSCITQCNLNERIISDTQQYLHVSYELTFFLSQKTDSSLSIQVFYSWKLEYKRFIVTVMSFLQISNTFLRKPC